VSHYQHINELLDKLEDTMGVIKIKEKDEYLADQIIMAQTFFCMGLLIAVLGAAVLLFDQLGLGVGTGMIIAGVVCVTLGIGLGVHVKRVERRTMRVEGNRGMQVKTGVHEGQLIRFGGEDE